jgi:Secretion system C-terminal sorting domain
MTKLKTFSRIVNFLTFFIFSAFTMNANTITVQTAAGGSNWLCSNALSTGWNTLGFTPTGWVNPVLAATCNTTQDNMLSGIPKIWTSQLSGIIDPSKSIPSPSTSSASTCYFRYTFNLEGLNNTALNLSVIGDDFTTVYLNGVQIGATANWTQILALVSTQNLNCGQNVLAFKVEDIGSCHYLAVSGSITGNAGAAVINGTTPVCEGTSTTLTTSGGGTYLWSNGATTSSTVVTPLTGTVYGVTVTSPSGCKLIGSKLIKTNPLPSVTIGTFPSVSCNKLMQAIVSQSISVPTASGYTYLWSNGSTAQNLSNAVNPSNPFSVTVTTSLGCKTVRSINYTNPCMASANPNKANNTVDNNSLAKQEFDVFPNPIREEVNIQFDIKDSEVAEVVIYNMLGNIIERQSAVSDNLKINMAQFPRGMYVISLIKNGSLVSSKKVIKQD